LACRPEPGIALWLEPSLLIEGYQVEVMSNGANAAGGRWKTTDIEAASKVISRASFCEFDFWTTEMSVIALVPYL
jgi:hypothetical protein